MTLAALRLSSLVAALASAPAFGAADAATVVHHPTYYRHAAHVYRHNDARLHGRVYRYGYIHGYGYSPDAAAAAGVVGGILGLGLASAYPYACDYGSYGYPYGACADYGYYRPDYGDYALGYGYPGIYRYGYGPNFYGRGYGRRFAGAGFGHMGAFRGFAGPARVATGSFGHMSGFGSGFGNGGFAHMGGFGGGGFGHMGGFGGGFAGGGHMGGVGGSAPFH